MVRWRWACWGPVAWGAEAGGHSSQCRSRLRPAAAAGGLACTGMDRSVPTFRSLTLWPLPLLAALVPLLAAHLAWALSLREDLIPGRTQERRGGRGGVCTGR